MRNKDHPTVFGPKNRGKIVAICRAPGPDIHNYVLNSTTGDPHDLGLCVRGFLVMQSPKYTFRRNGLIVLHKSDVPPDNLGEFLVVEGFKKHTSCIFMHLWF